MYANDCHRQSNDLPFNRKRNLVVRASWSVEENYMMAIVRYGSISMNPIGETNGRPTNHLVWRRTISKTAHKLSHRRRQLMLGLRWELLCKLVVLVCLFICTVHLVVGTHIVYAVRCVFLFGSRTALLSLYLSLSLTHSLTQCNRIERIGTFNRSNITHLNSANTLYVMLGSINKYQLIP